MWEEKDNALHQTFKFNSFTEAFAWMTAVAIEAEKMDHHPEWTNVYNTVKVKLTTHSAGNTVTGKDTKLAEVMDKYFSS